MVKQGQRTVLVAVLAAGMTVGGVFASANPSLAVPSSTTGVEHNWGLILTGIAQISSSAYQELALP